MDVIDEPFHPAQAGFDLGAKHIQIDRRDPGVLGNALGLDQHRIHLLQAEPGVGQQALHLPHRALHIGHEAGVTKHPLVGVADQADKLPSSLSGGQQQRVAIARSLANDPPLIVGDEPTGNLDRMSAAVVFEIFHELREQGRTVLIVSHDREILTGVPRLMVLTDGMIESTTLEAAARRRSQELQEVKLRTQERRAAHSDTQEHEAFQS